MKQKGVKVASFPFALTKHSPFTLAADFVQLSGLEDCGVGSLAEAAERDRVGGVEQRANELENALVKD